MQINTKNDTEKESATKGHDSDDHVDLKQLLVESLGAIEELLRSDSELTYLSQTPPDHSQQSPLSKERGRTLGTIRHSGRGLCSL